MGSMKFPVPTQAAQRLRTHVVHPSHYLLLATVFFVGFELIFAFHQWAVLLAFVLLAVVAAGIILVRTEEQGKFHPMQTILPILATTGLTAFALFLPTVPIIHLYFLASAAILFFLLKHGARQAYPTWNWVISTLILFLNVAAVSGWRFHLYAPLLYALPLICAIVFLISLQALSRIIPSTAETTLLSAATGFVLTEVAWTLQFLPLHYLVQSGVIVALYYVCFHLISLSYERAITRKDVLEYSLVGLAALLLVLMTAQWT